MALITCLECGREVSDQAAACPGCGAPVGQVASAPPPQPSSPQAKKKTPVWVTIAGVIILLFLCCPFLRSCSDVIGAGASGGAEGDAAPEGLVVVDKKAAADEYSVWLEGTIENRSGKTYSYVQIEVNMYDESGALLGSTLDNVNNLGPGESWKFKAVSLEEGRVTFKIKDVTGF